MRGDLRLIGITDSSGHWLWRSLVISRGPPGGRLPAHRGVLTEMTSAANSIRPIKNDVAWRHDGEPVPSSQNRSSTGAIPAKNRPDRLLPRHQQAEFSSATRHGAISFGCQIQRPAESKESKTLSAFRSHSGFLNKEFEHRLVESNGTLFANPQGNQMEPPLVIHAMSNSHWLSRVFFVSFMLARARSFLAVCKRVS